MKYLLLLIFIGLLSITIISCDQQTEKTLSPESTYYQEQHRPQFHFSPEANWMNDPNGMVYYEGEYHLFYQYYPDSNVWGPMHWGHAVSTDLVDWEHLPIALYPDELGYIFSGSAVIDWDNTSGFGENGKPAMVAIYTYHDPVGEKAKTTDFQYQGIAYSNDKGRTWTKYEGNPVIPNTEKIRDFRDPKVVWSDTYEQWLMVFAAHDRIKFYGSKNLKDWSHLSDFGLEYGAHGGLWECPDLYTIDVEGTDEQKYMLIVSLNPGSANGGSGTQYFIGDFNGKDFILDPKFEKDVMNGSAVWMDYGRDNYAGVTWSDMPESDGRRVFLGWMSNWDYAMQVPTVQWRSAMTIPRSLTLHSTDDGYRIRTAPVTELQKLRGNSHDIPAGNMEASSVLNLKGDISPSQCEIELEIEIGSKAKSLSLVLSNDKGEEYQMGYDAIGNTFFSDRMKSGANDFAEKFATKVHTAPRVSDSQTIKMRIFFDRSSVELFADDGTVAMTDIFFPTEDFNKITVNTSGEGWKLLSGKVYGLDSIWD